MPITQIEWWWEEAFDRNGFEDGDGANFTNEVRDALQAVGWAVQTDTQGMHNYMIECISRGNEDYEFDGGTDPRKILPKNVVAFLDERFPPPYNEPYDTSRWGR